jgi:Kef-type K+ transport system membrane component KefB
MPHVVQVLLLLALLVSAAKLAGALAARVGQPSVFGEILAGLLLGPTALNVLAWPLFSPAAAPNPGAASPPLLDLVRDLSDIGVVLLMFVAGLETDLAEMRRVGAVAFWAAFGGVLLPFVGGAAAAAAFGLPLRWEGVFVGTILTATSVSISAQTFIEIGQLRSREGSTILGAAVIDDVMGIVVLSTVVGFARASGFTTLEATRVGVGMISRGEVGLIVAGYGLSNGIIGRDVFSASVVMVLATTMVTPPLLRLTFPRRHGAAGAVAEEEIHAARPTKTGGPG